MDMKKPKYVVTALNRLTGEREAISRPHGELKTEELLAKARREHRRHHDGSCYSLFRIERVPQGEQQTLGFAPPLKPGLSERNDCISVCG